MYEVTTHRDVAITVGALAPVQSPAGATSFRSPLPGYSPLCSTVFCFEIKP